MTKFLVLMALTFSVQAENFVKLGVGFNEMLFSDQEWQDNGSMGCSFGIGNRHQLSGSWYGEVSYYHFSQCFTGPPFDDDYEDSLDAAYYYVEYRW